MNTKCVLILHKINCAGCLVIVIQKDFSRVTENKSTLNNQTYVLIQIANMKPTVELSFKI